MVLGAVWKCFGTSCSLETLGQYVIGALYGTVDPSDGQLLVQWIGRWILSMCDCICLFLKGPPTVGLNGSFMVHT